MRPPRISILPNDLNIVDALGFVNLVEEYSQIPGRIVSDNKILISRSKLYICSNLFVVVWNMLFQSFTCYYFLFVLRKFCDGGLTIKLSFVFRSYQNLINIGVRLHIWTLYSKQDIAPNDRMFVNEYCTWMYWILRKWLSKGGICILVTLGWLDIVESSLSLGPSWLL